jgi:hypothetical protein
MPRSPAKTAIIFCATFGLCWTSHAATALTINCGGEPCKVLPPGSANYNILADPNDEKHQKDTSPPIDESSNYFGGIAKVSIRGAPVPDVKATTNVTSHSSQEDTASGELIYQAQVVAIGIVPSTPIEVDITGTANISGSSTEHSGGTFFAEADATFTIKSPDFSNPNKLTYSQRFTCSSLGNNPCGTKEIRASGLVPLGGIINLDLLVLAQTGHSGEGTQDASAEIDPSIFIDPSFPNADMYEIMISPGVGNIPGSSAIPEPSTWAMMLLGFAGLGYGGLRARRATAARDIRT